MINKVTITKILFISFILILYVITRYFHSLHFREAGYGSGDAYRVILEAYTVENNTSENYLISYFYKIFHETTFIPFDRISFFITPIIGLLIVFIVFDIVRREYGFVPAGLTSLILILNPWLAYYSTEPSKEIFVLVFFLLAMYFLFRFHQAKVFIWLIFSFASFAAGILYYHSILIFFPYYFCLLVYFSWHVYGRQQLLKHAVLIIGALGIVFVAIAGPSYVIREVNYRQNLSEKPAYLKTDVDKQGNIFQRQFGAMYYAITKDREKLGMSKLIEGLDAFLLKQHAFIYLYGLVVLLSVFLLKKKKYVPLLFSVLTAYAFIIIGLQWTSYSHSSRYPQYIIYFLLLCLSLPLGWLIKLLKNTTLKVFILSLLVTLFFLTFNPFIRIDSFRDIYYPHIKVGESARLAGIKINKENQVLYQGWPSITVSLYENYHLQNSNYLHTFGWELVDLKGVTSKEYITSKQIKYFVYNDLGSDYFDSNIKVFKYLQNNFSLTPIRYVTDDKKMVVIYRIDKK